MTADPLNHFVKYRKQMVPGCQELVPSVLRRHDKPRFCKRAATRNTKYCMLHLHVHMRWEDKLRIEGKR